jgi:hypothetical protein
VLHGNWSKSNIFLALNRVWSFTTQSCCFGVYVIRIATRSCCFGIPDIFFNRELPDLGDDMETHLMEHVNEPVLAHLHTHYGAFQQYSMRQKNRDYAKKNMRSSRGCSNVIKGRLWKVITHLLLPISWLPRERGEICQSCSGSRSGQLQKNVRFWLFGILTTWRIRTWEKI